MRGADDFEMIRAVQKVLQVDTPNVRLICFLLLIFSSDYITVPNFVSCYDTLSSPIHIDFLKTVLGPMFICT